MAVLAQAVAAVDTHRLAIVAQQAHRSPYNDCAALRPLVEAPGRVIPIECVLADSEFDGECNHQYMRKQPKAQSIIPAKRGKADWHIQGVCAQMREHLLRRRYGRRSLIASVFSAVKRKLSARVPGHSTLVQQLQALWLGLAYNIYRI